MNADTSLVSSTPSTSAVRRSWRRFLRRAIALSVLVGVLFSGLMPRLLPDWLSSLALPVSAEAEAAPTTTDVGAALVCNLENNLTLYEKEADTPIYPASSVKIMTGLLACSALSDRTEESVTVTSAMLAGVTGRRMQLSDGEVLTVRDLLYAAICGSYNDAACVLACLVSGSVAAFVADMNHEAERLGTACTYYTNPTGLHDPAMATCVRDVAIIAREAYENELYMTISSTRTYTVPATNVSEERLFSNRNALISDSSQNYYNGYCRGLNAGMTDEGGWCVVTICERGGAANLAVVMRGKDVPSGELIPAYVYTNRLLSWANRAYTYRTVLAAGEVFDTASVRMTGISRSQADLVPLTDLKVYLPADVDVEGQLTLTAVLTDGELTAPLTAGQVVGNVTVSYEGRVVGKATLTVTEDYTRSAFLGGMMAFRDYLTGRAFWISVPIFTVALGLFLHATGSTGGRYGLRSARRRRIRYTRRYRQ